MHKGVFKSETTSTWHRKHKQHRTSSSIGAYNGGTDQLLSKQTLNQKSYFNQDTITNNNRNSIGGKNSVLYPLKSIRVDESGIEVPNTNGIPSSLSPLSSSSSSSTTTTTITSSIGNASAIGFNYNSSVSKRNKRTKIANHLNDHCAQEFWSENLAASNGILQQYSRKWSYNKTDLKSKTVSFRSVNIFHILQCIMHNVYCHILCECTIRCTF